MVLLHKSQIQSLQCLQIDIGHALVQPSSVRITSQQASGQKNFLRFAHLLKVTLQQTFSPPNLIEYCWQDALQYLKN